MSPLFKYNVGLFAFAGKYTCAVSLKTYALAPLDETLKVCLTPPLSKFTSPVISIPPELVTNTGLLL